MSEVKQKKLKPFVSRAWWKQSNQRTMGTLSKLSKAFLLPIALLPIAGIFLGVGATITSKVDANSGAWYFGNFLNQMGNIAFGNLPVLFAISVAMAYTEDAGVAALTAVIGFLVFNAIQFAFLHNEYSHYQYTVDIIGADGKAIFSGLIVNTDSLRNPSLMDPTQLLDWMRNSSSYDQLVKNADHLVIHASSTQVDSYGLLFYYGSTWAVQNKLTTANLGINSLNTGVFGGIFVGAVAAWAYNHFHKTQLPSALSFFSGSKLVPIITFMAVIPLAFIFMFIWPLIGTALAWFGNNSGKLPVRLDSLIFEIFERSLVPFGLHHVFYSPLWWTQAGGSMPDLINNVMNNPLDYKEFLAQINGLTVGGVQLPKFDMSTITNDQAHILVAAWVSHLNPNTIAAVGDQTIMYKIIADPWVTFTQIQDLGLNLGRFQSGKFPFMMFGLPAAAAAMWFAVPKENRKKVMGIYFSAAFTCFLTGITEPIEFTFLFVAPWLFYGVHMPLCAISFMLMGLLHVHTSMTVSGGFIDFIVFGIIPFISGKGTNFYHILWVGAIFIPVYFFAFYFAIKYGKIALPGREGAVDKLYTKADFKAKQAGKDKDAQVVLAAAGKGDDAKREKARKIIEFLGGEANITGVDSCASRLRLTVVDNTKVDPKGIEALGGCAGVLIRGTSVQCVYGGEQEVIKPYMQELLKEMREQKPQPK
ncbi:PTS transporter subunit EIIC [Spiroplasma eriocheiris]|uniref:PTS system glucose-specific IIBC component n=1 Tax=Spiroplasma eriocheiris TaxID=315358 RepID=A0A0H3XI85_9MOLU|nr:PTS transporter subunit EIIC [Spiroplasma eriocheiris]AHF58130.1 glucose-specific PTS system IICB component [Spiroplasma eriocheiris CCTCC M 207170]AKM54568.1 PTS system glucose-specific IIBC component [Spiroplasma eriocheiris]